VTATKAATRSFRCLRDYSPFKPLKPLCGWGGAGILQFAVIAPILFQVAPNTIRDRAMAYEPTDSVSGFRVVAVRRWEDGMALAGCRGAGTGAVYLMGYAAEIAMKIAVCELLGVPAGTDPWAWLRPQLTDLGFGRIGDVRNHDVRALWKQANDRREGLGLDLRDPAFHGAFRFHAWRVYTHWWEELRYKNVVASDQEVRDVAESSFWLLANLEEIYQ
jgi:hypothetical protein